MLEKHSADKTMSSLVRWMLGVAVLFAGVGWTSTAAADDLKIGYVDLHKALNNVEEGKKAKRQLRQNYKKKQKKLNQKQKEVKKLKKELKSGSMAMSKKAKMKKQKKLRRKMMQLQQTYMQLQRKLSKKEAKATKEIFEKMRKVVEKIAQEKNYDLVLEKKKSSVLYGEDAMDLTDELIKRYEKKY